MSKELRCSGMAVQDGLSQSMSGFSAWQSSCTWVRTSSRSAELCSLAHLWAWQLWILSWIQLFIGSDIFFYSRCCCHLSIFEGCCLSEPQRPPCSTRVIDPACSVPASLKHNWIPQNNCSCLYLEVCFRLAEGFVKLVSCPLFSIYFNWCNHRSGRGQEPSFSGLWCSAKSFDSPQSSKEQLE